MATTPRATTRPQFKREGSVEGVEAGLLVPSVGDLAPPQRMVRPLAAVVARTAMVLLVFMNLAGPALAVEPRIERVVYDERSQVIERTSSNKISPVDTEDMEALGRTVTLGKGYFILGRGVCSFIYVDRTHWLVSCRILNESYGSVSAFLNRPKLQRSPPVTLLMMANSCPLWGACAEVTCSYPRVTSTVATLTTELNGYDSERLASIKAIFRYALKTDSFMGACRPYTGGVRPCHAAGWLQGDPPGRCRPRQLQQP